ncbi:MAG: tRNA pseudouridine(54/55) synthase Pus10 [Nitrososphaerales archaeon]
MSSKAKAILKKYPLCSRCLERQVRLKAKYPTDTKECFICGNFFEHINDVVKTVATALNEYEFQTFSIGLSAPNEWIEKEDMIRSEFKLRGVHNIKSEASYALTLELSRVLNKRLDRFDPDVVAIVDVVSRDVKVLAKSVYLFGRYTKSKRGLPQKQPRCKVCRGRGCPECGYTGKEKQMSVEQLLSQRLLNIFKGSKVTFSWCGSEDEQSLVLGEGRPFYVEVHNPKKRNLPSLNLPFKLGFGVKLKQLTLLAAKPEKMPSFRSEVLARVLFQSKPDKKKLKEASALLERSEIYQASLSKRKTYVKKIYLFKIRVVGCKGFIRFICDGGLSIKRFLTGAGEPITPNLPSLLGVNIDLDEHKPFDILDVMLEGF